MMEVTAVAGLPETSLTEAGDRGAQNNASGAKLLRYAVGCAVADVRLTARVAANGRLTDFCSAVPVAP